MFAILRKEISGFFSSLTGYIVITVFLCINGLFIWVFPGNMNILDSGFASLSPLFTIAPWVFLFLVPAVTMRSFAEEKKAGTLDLLYTRPLSDLQIVLGKYFAAVVLISMALVPVLIYYFSVIKLGSTPGNIDHGAFFGSFLGLLLLASCYAAVGILASAFTENTIVSFLMTVLISFALFSGFSYTADLFPFGGIGNTLQNLGIEAHYTSMSRGVIDSRDIVYFLSVITIFIYRTKLKLSSRNW